MAGHILSTMVTPPYFDVTAHDVRVPIKILYNQCLIECMRDKLLPVSSHDHALHLKQIFGCPQCPKNK